MPPKRLHVTVNDGADRIHDEANEILADGQITLEEFTEFLADVEQLLITPALTQADAVRLCMVGLGHGIETAWFGRQMREHIEDMEILHPQRLEAAREHASVLALEVA